MRIREMRKGGILVEDSSRRKRAAVRLFHLLLEFLDLAFQCVDRLVDRLLEGAGAVFGHHILAGHVQRDGRYLVSFFEILIQFENHLGARGAVGETATEARLSYRF